MNKLDLLKLFWENFKHYPTTGAVITTAAAYYLNTNTQTIPQAYADVILMVVTIIVGTFFAGKQSVTIGAPKK